MKKQQNSIFCRAILLASMHNMVSSRYHPRYVLIVGEAMKLSPFFFCVFHFTGLMIQPFDDDDFIGDVLI
jgi:hypothetical protein